ncbi:MAG: class I SAM-dependent methyltransferase [Planctomycetota bacterium]|jgi:SAM-dependent methyltransferase
MTDEALHARDPIGRFSGRADAYAAWRPGYPEEAIDVMLMGLGEPSTLVAGDVGAGTGISSRALASRGVRVWAVEPNEEMRAAADKMVVGHVEWVDATAEATGLPDASCDLVLCAQAFQWFDRDAALLEFHRILQPAGRIALIWNTRDTADPLMIEYERLVEAIPDNPGSRARACIRAPLADTRLFAHPRRLEFGHQQRLTLEGLLGRAMSVSYFPRSGPGHDKLVAALRALHERACDYEGKVAFRYRTVLWLAEPA